MPTRPKGPWLRKGRGYFCWLNGRQISLKTENLEDAWTEFYRLMGSAGIPTAAAGLAPISVHEIVDRFALWADKHRSPLTAAWYRQFLDDFLERSPIIQKLPASKLRPYHVQEWIDKHADWSTTTQNRAASAVKRAYSWALEQGLIEGDPIRAMKKAKPKRRLRILTAAEWKDVVKACPNDAIQAFLKVQRLTGARPQELRAAEVRHYDRAGRCLRFPADESKGGIARVIVLPVEAVAVVEECIGDRSAGSVFLNTEGKPWTRVGLRMALRRLVAASGVQFDAYTLRHSFATDALTKGLDALTVGVLMGHVDPSMVGRVYQHLDQKPAYLRQAAETASQALPASERTGGKRATKKAVPRPSRVVRKSPTKKAGRKAKR